MTVSVDAVVMFHPLRASAADALADRIGARLVGDPSPELPPSVPGTWRTARAAWASVGEGRGQEQGREPGSHQPAGGARRPPARKVEGGREDRHLLDQALSERDPRCPWDHGCGPS